MCLRLLSPSSETSETMSGSSPGPRCVFVTCSRLRVWRVESSDRVMWRHDVTWPKLGTASQVSEMWLGSKYAMRKICWLISLFERFQFNVLHRFSLEYLVIFRSSRQIFEFMLNTFSIFMIWNHHCVTVSNSKMSVSMWRVEKHLTWTQTKNNDERSLFYDILWTNYYS